MRVYRATRAMMLGSLLVLACISCSTGPPSDSSPDDVVPSDTESNSDTPSSQDGESADGESSIPQIRVATYNASLYRDSQGQLVDDLSGGEDEQARRVAEVIQTMRPDVLLINEFDWDAEGRAAELFADEYLAVSQGDAEAIEYPHRFVPESNTGQHSGVDLDGNGEAVDEPGSQNYGNDAFGFGTFPGQYGMVIYSRFPIDREAVRAFRNLLWKDMPNNLLPNDFYSEAAVDVFRLSSKNHVDVPVEVDGQTIHVLASHPTPPSFDGDEDRNGRRNHDEIRFWKDYVSGGESAGYIRDDRGGEGGLEADARFVVLGDLNSDPRDGDSRHVAIRELIGHASVTDPEPSSDGARLAAERDGQVNASHETPARLDTADFSDGRVGNLRVDYVLHSSNTGLSDAGVFWPEPEAKHAELATVSDHHLVWVDLLVE